MKKKTFDVQHDGRVREEPRTYHVREAKGKTPNVQRPTSNVQRTQENSAPWREKPYDLEDRLLEYAVRVIRLVDALPPTKAGRHVADQLLRCGTSPLANHGELQGAESRKDFICLKEIREAQRWLRLIRRVPLVAPGKIEPLLVETEALIKIFATSIRTAEKNSP